MKMGPREQLILVIVGLVLVLVVVGALLVWPQIQKLNSMDAQVAVAHQQVQSAEALLAQRQTIKNRAADTDAQWIELATLVPENPDLPSLIIDLQDAAFASGVQLQSVAPSDPKASLDGTYLMIPMELKIWGTWADTVDYLKRIMELNRGLRITESGSSLLDAASPSNPQLPEWSVSTVMQIEAYVIPASQSASAAVPAPVQ